MDGELKQKSEYRKAIQPLFKEFTDQIKIENKDLKKFILKLAQSFAKQGLARTKAESSTKVTNLPEVQKVTGEVDIKFPKIQTVEVKNFPAIPKPPKVQKVQITNPTKIPKPPEVRLEKLETLMKSLIETVELSKADPVKFPSPMPVKVMNQITSESSLSGSPGVIRGWDSENNVPVKILVDPVGNVFIRQFAVSDTPETFEDPSFESGDSPAILDCNEALGRNAREFSVINDGAGDFTVSISNDADKFGAERTVKNGETYAITDISVDSIRITHDTDSAYRVVVI